MGTLYIAEVIWIFLKHFDVLLTVYLSIILATDQLNVQILVL